jgi:hypothetical protein
MIWVMLISNRRILKKAKEYFKEYLKNPKPEFKNDAELRLADTYYAGN